MMNGKRVYICGVALAALVAVSGGAHSAQKSPLWPTPSVIDYVYHIQGNIGLTVYNFGIMGDIYFAGLPSGDWPTNTGHGYLAEMRFWMGGINAAGDTLLANSGDDFNPLPNLGASVNPYEIMVSTDTTTYDYNPTDTVGLGIGYPAYGWRIWDVVSQDWEYNQVYSTLSSSYHPGGPVSVQESICRYADDGMGTPLMGLEVTQTVRQWNYKHINDMIFVTMEITNASADDYHGFAIGLYCDFDVGGLDPVSGDNGRLGDLVAVDTALDLAWGYDEDGYDPGWGPGVRTGYMGTVILSTPGDVGMTSFFTDQWELLPTTDRARYRIIDGTAIADPLPPTDQYYLQAVRGIDLPAGQTIRFDFALIAGATEARLKEVAEDARTLFANNFISSRPPDNAEARATARNYATAISWDDLAESSVDPSTGSTDFRGYKVFRSDNRGITWGNLITNTDGSIGPDYVPIAQFERDAFDRISHTLIDSNLINGMEYWYAVVPYDSTGLEIDFTSGSPGNSSFVARSLPRSDPLGYLSPQATLEHTYTGDWVGVNDAVRVYVIDQAAITGDEYRVTFTDDCASVHWYLTNTTTGDTVLIDQDQSEGQAGSYPVTDGFQVVIDAPNVTEHRLPDTAYQSAFAAGNDPTILPNFVEKFYPEDVCHSQFRNDVEIRFTTTGSIGYDFAALVWLDEIVQVQLPFEAWNVTTNTQLDIWIADWNLDGQWNISDFDWIIMTNYPYDGGTLHLEALPDYVTWVIELNDASAPVAGDVYTVSGPRVVSPEDEYTFVSDKIVFSAAAGNLDRIHTVPNPYIGYAKWETGRGERKLQFVNLPDVCTIRIYTLAGEIISTLRHDDGTGTQDWDMLSEMGRGIAAGVYLYHVDSQYGTFTGKFAVLK